MKWINGKLLGGKKEVVKDCVFKRPVKNTLSLSFLDSFSSFITLISLILYYFTNIKDIFKN